MADCRNTPAGPVSMRHLLVGTLIVPPALLLHGNFTALLPTTSETLQSCAAIYGVIGTALLAAFRPGCLILLRVAVHRTWSKLCVVYACLTGFALYVLLCAGIAFAAVTCICYRYCALMACWAMQKARQTARAAAAATHKALELVQYQCTSSGCRQQASCLQEMLPNAAGSPMAAMHARSSARSIRSSSSKSSSSRSSRSSSSVGTPSCSAALVSAATSPCSRNITPVTAASVTPPRQTLAGSPLSEAFPCFESPSPLAPALQECSSSILQLQAPVQLSPVQHQPLAASMPLSGPLSGPAVTPTISAHPAASPHATVLAALQSVSLVSISQQSLQLPHTLICISQPSLNLRHADAPTASRDSAPRCPPHEDCRSSEARQRKGMVAGAKISLFAYSSDGKQQVHMEVETAVPQEPPQQQQQPCAGAVAPQAAVPAPGLLHQAVVQAPSLPAAAAPVGAQRAVWGARTSSGQIKQGPGRGSQLEPRMYSPYLAALAKRYGR